MLSMTCRRIRRCAGTLAVAALASALLAPGARAQVQPFVAAGLAVPAGSIAEPDAALPDGDAGLGMQLDAGLAFGLQRGAVDVRVFGTYATMSRDFDFSNREWAQTGLDVRQEGEARVIGAGGGVAYYFPTALVRNVFPYVVASAGIYQQRHTLEFVGDDVTPGEESTVESATRLGAAGGLGLVWAPGRIRVFLESRVQGFMSRGERPGYLIPVQLGIKLGPP